MSERQLVICELGGQRYGLDIGRVREIIRPTPITSVPGAPPYVEGVLNLRGRIIPVVDLAARLALPAGHRTRASRIVVVDAAAGAIGLVVDGVSEVRLAPAEAIEAPPPIAAGADYLAGIVRFDERLVTLLELDRLFGTELGALAA